MQHYVIKREKPFNMENLSNITTNFTLFIFSPYARGISGFAVWVSVLVTSIQIFQHLYYYTVAEQQLWIIRILFIVPIYAVCSWLSLLFYDKTVYFDAIRSCYEAFVIYNFLRLCIEYLGGEHSIIAQLREMPMKRRYWDGTCCFPKRNYSVGFLRLCKQFTLQFCVVKPVMAVITIILELTGTYKEGEWSLVAGYTYITIIYNISVTIALYGLVMFYSATRHLLRRYKPVLKFLAIKSVVFLSFWQGVALSVLTLIKIIDTAEVADAYQNFIITLEMFLASILLHFAFPVSPYKRKNRVNLPSVSINKQVRNITINFRDTLNPQDMINDAIHNFSRTYQKYAYYDNRKEECEIRDLIPEPPVVNYHRNHVERADSQESIELEGIEINDNERLLNT
eukprot:TRINITY_DN2250_c1_g1_i1.p1 TRINITY_DN2250_c1_g1~~TRINITY_DN2250_c1_g1_i1.p1  ORF type:complete len:396 (+),score=60.73 TRINITY_DN2250_c1_g1_i1:92-1279(+)